MAKLNPKFLEANYIDDVTTIAISSGDNTNNKVKLIDRNSDTLTKTSNESTGTRTITWTPATAKTIDTIYIQNTNISTFTIKYNTSTDFSTAITETTSTDTNYFYTFNSQAVNDVVITVTACHDEPAELSIGQLYIGSEYFTLSMTSGVNVQIIPEVKQEIFPLADGTTKKLFLRRTIGYTMECEQVSVTERANYYEVYQANRTEAVVFIPQPRTGTDAWLGVGGHVNWINAFEFENYNREIEENGYRGMIELAQAGGI